MESSFDDNRHPLAAAVTIAIPATYKSLSASEINSIWQFCETPSDYEVDPMQFSETSSASEVDPTLQFSETPSDSEVDPTLQFPETPSASEVDPTLKIYDDANGRSTLNMESSLEDNGHPLATAVTVAIPAGVVSPWNWRETNGNGEQSSSFRGRVISIKWEGSIKLIGIDGTPGAIKEAIKTAFRLRTGHLFCLEDEDHIVRTIDRDMPLGNYTLHLDEGVTIKICVDEVKDPNHLTEDKTFYCEEEFHEFLSRRGWTLLREYNGYRSIDSIVELFPNGIYRGVNRRSVKVSDNDASNGCMNVENVIRSESH